MPPRTVPETPGTAAYATLTGIKLISKSLSTQISTAEAELTAAIKQADKSKAFDCDRRLKELLKRAKRIANAL